jgi:hypothetical protein
MEFASGIGQMPVVQLWNNNTAALDADVESVQGKGGGAKAVVGLIESIEDTRVRSVIETMGTEEKIKGTKTLRGLGETRIVGPDAFARSR